MDERAQKAAYRARQQEKGLASSTVWVPVGSELQKCVVIMDGAEQSKIFSDRQPAAN